MCNGILSDMKYRVLEHSHLNICSLKVTDRQTCSVQRSKRKHEDRLWDVSVIEQEKQHLLPECGNVSSPNIELIHFGATYETVRQLSFKDNVLNIFSGAARVWVNKAVWLPERERERECAREREVHRSLRTSWTVQLRRNIMELVQIKSGKAELPIKIFIIPQTFGYRGVWN